MPPGGPIWHLRLSSCTVAMRSAGCTYNDIVDRDIDAVARTRSRDPERQVSVGQAKLFLVAQALVGLVVPRSTGSPCSSASHRLTIAVYLHEAGYRWPPVGLGIAFS
jgi:4-hydroxybenzoate polyprenyltransferase